MSETIGPARLEFVLAGRSGQWSCRVGRRRLILLSAGWSVCLLVLLSAQTAAGRTGSGARPPALAARVDPRVELMSIIFRLAGNREYNMPISRSPYASDVEKRFGPHRNDAVIAFARQLHRSRGVSYDAVMSMALHIKDLDGWAEAVPFDKPPKRLDARWKPDQARQFVKLARQFAVKTDFAKFFDEHKNLYRQAEERMTRQLGRHKYRQWFDRFFGGKPKAGFSVVVGLLNGGSCYGSGVVYPDGTEEIVPIIGCWKFDRQGVPVFDDSFADTIAHEFCHSYTNPLVDGFADQLEPAGAKIWPHRAAQMRRQAYGNWRTMMYESLVRACVVRFVLDQSGQAAAQRAAEAEAQRGFTWTAGLAKLLAQYEANRRKYPKLDKFMPQVAEFFNRTAKDLAKQSANAPKVLQITPANGDQKVDPSVKTIVIRFDREMTDGSWSIVGGGPKFPKITGNMAYDRKRMVLSVPVSLQPNRQYEFWLNSGKFAGFKSRQGVPLEPVHVTFRTRPAG